MSNAKTTECIEMTPGWYAKTMNAMAQEHGPFTSQARAIAAVKATGANLAVQGLKTWNHRGGLMVVYR